MMKRAAVLILGVALAGLAGASAHAAIVVGDPEDGGSWSQYFEQRSNEASYNPKGTPFDLIAVRMETSPGDSFVKPVFSAFVNAAGWASLTPGTGQTQSSAAAGPADDYIKFKLTFVDPKTNPFHFDLAVFALGVNDNNPVQSQHVMWSGTAWSFVQSGPWKPNRTEIIPEPCSLIVWSLIGGFGIGGAWLRRKKRAA